ncbi:MAG: alpha/beta fold hydrolase [Desulfomonilaceae bacterium]
MLTLIPNIIFSCALFILLVYGFSALWKYLEYSETRQDRTDYVKTRDGWRIAIHNYRPSDPVQGKPVILCHGIASNRFMFDLDNAPSLAGFLKNGRRDVWVAELRGSGCSDQPGLLLSNRPMKWTFDDHLTYDVEAIIEHVMKQTGAGSVHWVGHSMGGMLAQAYISRTGSSSVASVIALGSPVNFESIKNHLFAKALRLRPILRILPFNPLMPLIKLLAPVGGLFPGILSIFVSCGNIERLALRKVTAMGLELISSSAVWLDIARFVDSGKFSDSFGKPYLEKLRGSPTPLLSICGSKDLMAPERSVQPCSCNTGGEFPIREKIVLGKDSGQIDDYGHIDLLLGVRAQEEVFPLVEQWLSRWDCGDEAEVKP